MTEESNMKQRADEDSSCNPQAGALTRLRHTGERLLPDGQPGEYCSLNVGPYTSLITKVQIGRWGSEVSLSCLYDPLGARMPYQVMFHDCTKMEWRVHSSQYTADAEADIYEFALMSSKSDHARIYTDIFELAIWYGSYEVLKEW